MEWSKRKDILLCKEILQVEPFKTKEKTVNRAQAWQKVADNLNKCPEFKVTKRSVQDHYKVLVEKFKRKTNKELRASGISPEPTELDVLLEEIVERAEASEQTRDEEDDRQREKIRKEQEQAKDVRLKAMETMKETKKRAAADAGDESRPPTKKKSRSNGSEMVAYLKERANEEISLKEKDIEIRSLQVEKEANRQELLDRQHNSLMEVLLKQQQQQQQFQQQQQQQFMQMQAVMAQQQQQQHQMLMAILEKRN